MEMSNELPSLLRQTLARFSPQSTISASTYSVLDPSNGKTVATVTNATSEAVKSAIARAGAFKTLAPTERMAMLSRWHSLILDRSDELATIATLESGKPLREAKGEAGYAASFVRYYAHEALATTGSTLVSPHPRSETRLWTLRAPVGPCALITPWNFPLAMATRKLAPALAAGNACILKPAPETPLCALALRVLATEAGIPEDAFQVLTADREVAKDVVGMELMASLVVRKLSFTGSSPAGVALTEQAARTMKRVSMELGGNAPFIVFEDADMDRSVDGCMGAKFRNAGQACISVNRVYVHSSLHDEFVEKLSKKMDSLKVGNGFDVTVNIGPLISPSAVQKVSSLVEASLSAGATLSHQIPLRNSIASSGGNYFPPTLLTNVTDEMPAFKDEIFGPIVSVAKFESENEVVRRANNTPYGLAAYVYTSDVARVHRVSELLQTGMVGVNESVISCEVAPFGGVGMSGVGREGAREGMDAYLETKYVCLGL
ncbi:succinate-semialdehyde dehydrogenase [Chytriomyces sp. MP71]|nr:succinate-semialdehyde dehydrogenase [Chytriomyces sp. MP71]